MKTNNNKRPLIVILSLVFGSLIFLSFIIIMSYNYYKTSKQSHSYINNVQNDLASKTIFKVMDYLNEGNSALKIISGLTPSLMFDNYENIHKVMEEYIKDKKHLSSIFIADEKANFIQVRKEPHFETRIIKKINNVRYETWIRDNKASLKELSKYNPTLRPWYKKALKNQFIISKPYIFESTKKLGITVSYAKYENKKKVLVSAVDISLNNLLIFVKKEAQKIKGIVLIMSSSGDIIVSSQNQGKKNTSLNTIYDLEKNNIVALSAKAYLRNNTTILDKEGEKYIYVGKQFSPSKNLSWNILIIVPEGIVLKGIKESFFEGLFISIFMLLLFILILKKFLNSISLPITKLTKDIERLVDLDLKHAIDNNSNIYEIKVAQDALIALKIGLNSFSKYVPNNLVKILVKSKKEIKIGGEEKQLAIMFTDIEGFTSISEEISNQDLTKYLSQYFHLMQEIISRNEGTIDKYIGDAVMAFWGAPLDIKNPIHKAVLSALEIQKVLEIFNTNLFKNFGFSFKTRIGLHYGKTIVGNIGSSKRMNYTIIGDSVNVAARLENINKVYQTKIIVSSQVFEAIKDDFTCKYLDSIELKGKSVATKIYEVKSLNTALN
ncbi:MAG: hypothetical protein HRT41_14975 [Campylobacteraceae bacterium]|nr:hypothetical protein [Campylobacteraceae bacterium]